MADAAGYVYVHYRETDGTPFYVGKGSCKYRAHQKTGRSKHWKNVAAKHGLRVEILESGLTCAEAFALEIQTIREMRDRGENLVNITAGGDGARGYKQSPSHIAKRVEKQRGRKWSEESREKVRGRTVPQSVRDKISNTVSGFRHTAAARKKISEAQMGEKHHFYDGVPRRFWHPVHGHVVATQHALANAYNLHKSNLCSVIKGRKKSVTGWLYIGESTDDMHRV